MKKIYDFSGYICTYKIFKDFFEKNKFDFEDKSYLNVLSLQLIDCSFMNYLDNFNWIGRVLKETATKNEKSIMIFELQQKRFIKIENAYN